MILRESRGYYGRERVPVDPHSMTGLSEGPCRAAAYSSAEIRVNMLRLPGISLDQFAQDELLLLAKCHGGLLAHQYHSQIIVPRIDRRLFNESEGSRKQTYRNWEDLLPKPVAVDTPAVNLQQQGQDAARPSKKVGIPEVGKGRRTRKKSRGSVIRTSQYRPQVPSRRARQDTAAGNLTPIGKCSPPRADTFLVSSVLASKQDVLAISGAEVGGAGPSDGGFYQPVLLASGNGIEREQDDKQDIMPIDPEDGLAVRCQSEEAGCGYRYQISNGRAWQDAAAGGLTPIEKCSSPRDETFLVSSVLASKEDVLAVSGAGVAEAGQTGGGVDQPVLVASGNGIEREQDDMQDIMPMDLEDGSAIRCLQSEEDGGDYQQHITNRRAWEDTAAGDFTPMKKCSSRRADTFLMSSVLASNQDVLAFSGAENAEAGQTGGVDQPVSVASVNGIEEEQDDVQDIDEEQDDVQDIDEEQDDVQDIEEEQDDVQDIMPTDLEDGSAVRYQSEEEGGGMLERIMQMLTSSHMSAFGKPKLESRGGKRKLSHIQQSSAAPDTKKSKLEKGLAHDGIYTLEPWVRESSAECYASATKGELPDDSSLPANDVSPCIQLQNANEIMCNSSQGVWAGLGVTDNLQFTDSSTVEIDHGAQRLNKESRESSAECYAAATKVELPDDCSIRSVTPANDVSPCIQLQNTNETMCNSSQGVWTGLGVTDNPQYTGSSTVEIDHGVQRMSKESRESSAECYAAATRGELPDDCSIRSVTPANDVLPACIQLLQNTNEIMCNSSQGVWSGLGVRDNPQFTGSSTVEIDHGAQRLNKGSSTIPEEPHASAVCSLSAIARQVPNSQGKEKAEFATPPRSPKKLKLKEEMERRLAAIEGKWLTEKRKVVIADNFPEGWTVCVFLRTKGGRATLEYRSWKSPEGKVFGTFKEAADFVQSATGVVVKNRGCLPAKQMRERKYGQGESANGTDTGSGISTEVRERPGASGLEEKGALLKPNQPDKSHFCTVCPGTFSSKKNLRRHMKRAHPTPDVSASGSGGGQTPYYAASSYSELGVSPADSGSRACVESQQQGGKRMGSGCELTEGRWGEARSGLPGNNFRTSDSRVSPDARPSMLCPSKSTSSELDHADGLFRVQRHQEQVAAVFSTRVNPQLVDGGHFEPQSFAVPEMGTQLECCRPPVAVIRQVESRAGVYPSAFSCPARPAEAGWREIESDEVAKTSFHHLEETPSRAAGSLPPEGADNGGLDVQWQLKAFEDVLVNDNSNFVEHWSAAPAYQAANRPVRVSRNPVKRTSAEAQNSSLYSTSNVPFPFLPPLPLSVSRRTFDDQGGHQGDGGYPLPVSLFPRAHPTLSKTGFFMDANYSQAANRNGI